MGLRVTETQIKKVKKMSLSEDKYKLTLPFFKIEDGILRPYGDTKFKDIIYNDSEPWIECAIKYFTDSLKIKPELVSICRSLKSGFTPKKYARFTEQTLITYLMGRYKNKIDPCDIVSTFKIYPFITCIGNTIYNPLTDDIIKLNKDSRFIWERIQMGKNFPQIFEAMLKAYDIEPEHLKGEILKFIFRLKKGFIIK